jgi:dihydropteroate synthase
MAVSEGAVMINDISGGSLDPLMFKTIGQLKVPYVLMHIQGSPENMQQNPQYKDVVNDIKRYFAKKIEELRHFGVHDIILDPGFGFGKTVAHNFSLLNNLRSFRIFGLPVLAGVSRKSFIQKTLGVTAEEALNGTTVLNTLALLNGADILRVHDVREAWEVVALLSRSAEG